MNDPVATQVHQRFSRFLLVLVGAAPVAALLALWQAHAGEDRELLLARLMFWAMPFVLAFVGVAAFVRSRAVAVPFGARWQKVSPGAAYAIALTLLLFWLVPPQLRVQFDETNIVGASQNMQRLDMSMVTIGAIPYEGEVFPRDNIGT